jgi:hypothetical protein
MNTYQNKIAKECELGVCDGSGVVTKWLSADDFETDFCPCEIGEQLADTERFIERMSV